MSLAVLGCVVAAFSYKGPGQLQSDTAGRADATVYLPDLRFPIEMAPAYANSQVYGVGGIDGPAGSECDARNFSYPWWDNYCEPRAYDMPLCPGGVGHQGQDIRAATCADNTHWVVATEDGTVTAIGAYSVYHMGASGTLHRYLHMEPTSLTVTVGTEVSRGQRLGRVSNAFGGSPTTVHLHYDVNEFVAGIGNVYLPTYMSLVRAYEALVGEVGVTCPALGARGGVLDDGDGCAEFYGPPATWRLASGEGFAGELHWTNAWSGAAPANWARWRVSPAAAYGRYRVSVYLLPSYAESQRVPYHLRHADREEDLVVDTTGISGWHELGVYDFSAATDQWVDIYDNTGEAAALALSIMADAAQLERLDVGECAALPAAGGIIDNASPCFSLHGSADTWRFVSGAGHDGSLHWTHAWEGALANWARWTVAPSEPGLYRVEVYVDDGYADSTGAKYVVAHAGGETTFTRDISSVLGWVWLGDFDFAATGAEHVTVRDDTGEPLAATLKLPADAVRLTRRDAPSEPVSGGCNAAGAGLPWLVLCLPRRRRVADAEDV